MPASTVGSLVGRERELALLDAFLHDSPAGGSALVIRGEAGTGKSALLDRARTAAADLRRPVLRAVGVQAEARMPFAGLHHLVRPVLHASDALAAVQRQALAGAFGPAGGHPEIFLVALATLSLLSDVAAQEPVLLVIDDAQWLDGATLEVLSFVARRLESDPIAMLLAVRMGFDVPIDVPSTSEVELDRLDDEASATLLDDRFPELRPLQREQVLAFAAGNALALLELPHAFASRMPEPGADVPLTKRLERAFASRILDLPLVTRELTLVAALDEQLSLADVLATTSRLVSAPVTLQDLAPAETARLLVLDGAAVRFGHPLMSSAVRQTASTARKHAAHSAIAETLATQPARSVWHRAACALGPDERLAAQLETVAAELRTRDGALAVAGLRRAGELSSTPVRAGRRLVDAAEVALELGRDDEVRQLLDQADPLPLDRRTRHSLLWLRESLREASGAATVRSTVALAEQLIAEDEIHLALQALFTSAVRCYMFRTDADLSGAVAAAAAQLDLPAQDATVAAINALARPDTRGPDVVARLASVTPDGVAAAQPDRGAAAEGQHLYALALTCIGEFRLGVGFQDAAIAGFRAQGRLGLLSRALGSHSVVRLGLADWRAATQAADECLRLSGYVLGSPDTATDGERVLNAGSCLLVLGTVAAHQGRFDRAAELIDESDRVHGTIGSNYCMALLQAARASLALAAGRPLEAFDYAARIYDPEDAAHHVAVARWAIVLHDLADAAAASGNTAAVIELLGPLERASGTAEHRAALAYADAVLAAEDFETQFQRALALAPASRFFLARLQLAYGTRLRRGRRVVDARTQLRAAANGFDAIGGMPWGERARQELRASGETIRSPSRDRRDELSPQEMQIAQLAGRGLTNREIAARLFVSHRTVGSHLYRIFPKLGISSRAALSAALEDTSLDAVK